MTIDTLDNQPTLEELQELYRMGLLTPEDEVYFLDRLVRERGVTNLSYKEREMAYALMDAGYISDIRWRS